MEPISAPCAPKTKKLVTATTSLALFAFLGAGCELAELDLTDEEIGQTDQAVVTSNRLISNRLISNSLMQGYTTMEKLTDPLSSLKYSFRSELSSSATRDFLKYVVECGLNSKQSVQFQYISYYPYKHYATRTYYGALGFAPEWRDDHCDTACQEKVTGCVLARTNYLGQAVDISVRTWGDVVPSWESSEYYVYEGAFYGNFFSGQDEMFYCMAGLYNIRVCDNVHDPDCPIYFTGFCGHPGSNSRACVLQDSGGQYAVCAAGDYVNGTWPLVSNKLYTYSISSYRNDPCWECWN